MTSDAVPEENSRTERLLPAMFRGVTFYRYIYCYTPPRTGNQTDIARRDYFIRRSVYVRLDRIADML